MKEKESLVIVIGEDRKIHLAYPWENKTVCGVSIIDKTPSEKILQEKFSCYECLY